jgi:hypothetical protein
MRLKPIAFFVIAALAAAATQRASAATGDATPAVHGTRYTQADIALRGYARIVVEPVTLQYAESALDDGVAAKQTERVCDASGAALREAVGARFEIVTEAGPGTILLRASVRGVQVAEKRRRFWQYTPLGLVKTRIDSARGANVTLPSATIEIELVDALTGETLASVAETDDYASWRDVVGRLDGWVRHIIDDPRRFAIAAS